MVAHRLTNPSKPAATCSKIYVVHCADISEDHFILRGMSRGEIVDSRLGSS